jgi:hypothetical protein
VDDLSRDPAGEGARAGKVLGLRTPRL